MFFDIETLAAVLHGVTTVSRELARSVFSHWGVLLVSMPCQQLNLPRSLFFHATFGVVSPCLEGTMATPEFKSAMQTRTSNINEMNDVFNGSRFISLPNAAPAGGDALDELTNSRVEGENKPPVWKHSVSTGSLHARAAQNILS